MTEKTKLVQWELSPHASRVTDVILYPTTGESWSPCVALFIANRAQPEWIQISCVEKIANHIVCSVATKVIYAVPSSPEFLVQHKSCVIKNNTCFLFFWHRSVELLPDKCHKNQRIQWKIGDFWFLFDAIHAPFPPLFTQTMTHIFTFYKETTRFLRVWSPSSNTSKALYICSQRRARFVQGGNIFLCASGAYISQLAVCDGLKDCGDHESSDEIGCTCKSGSQLTSKCKYILDNKGMKRTSQFYQNTKSHFEHEMFNFFDTTKRENTELLKTTTNAFYCHFGRSIPAEFVDDLIGDCGVFAEDEPQLNTLAHSPNVIQQYICNNYTQIPCRIGLALCFNIFQICTYTLNTFGKLIPCATGEHLQNCDQFECNMMFKCLKFYCVPWAYVSDTKWDCPDGYDEFTGHTNCEHLFLCRESQVCIDLGQVCDQERDCKWADDEDLCSLQHAACPSGCECLTFVLLCQSVHSMSSSLGRNIPYYIINITECREEFVEKILTRTAKQVSLVVRKSGLTQMCVKVHIKAETLFVDVGHNNVSIVENDCFDGGQMLANIQLDDNQISQIQEKAFHNLSNLILIDLQNNFLSNIPEQIMTKSIRMIDIRRNALQDISVHILEIVEIDFLLTNNYGICCPLPEAVSCSEAPPWYKSCKPLLPNLSLRIVFYCFSGFIWVVNLVSISLQRQPDKKSNDQSKAFRITIVFVNITDILCAIILCILWIADLFYDDHFVVKEKHWASSAVCFFIFGLTLYFSYFAPALLSFVAFSRLSVVLHPMNTKVKRISFVSKVIGTLLSIFVIIALVTTFTQKALYSQVPNNWCSASYDPQGDTALIQVTIFLVMILEVIAFWFIMIANILMVAEVFESKKKVAAAISRRSSMKGLVAQIVVLNTFNGLCWISSSVIFILCMFLHRYPIMIEGWTMATVTTINSFTSPLVCIITTMRKTQS